MASRRIDWWAIPQRYRAWQAKPTWRKVLWLVSKTLAMVVLYVPFAAIILWYNEPELVEGIAGGSESMASVFTLFAGQPELFALMLILLPAVAAAVILPHRTVWN